MTLEGATASVLAVSRWKEVFETAESRRYASLTWISCPISFNSTGFQNLLDTFEGTQAAALYGAWHALLRIAATSPNRGVLAGQKGEPYTAGRLSRLSGFPADLFETLIDWCLTVGWLVVTRSPVELPNRTEPDMTEPNQTRPDRTGPQRTQASAPPACDPAAVQAQPVTLAGPARPGVDLFFESLCQRFESPKFRALLQRPPEQITQSVKLALQSAPNVSRQVWTLHCGWEDVLLTRMKDTTTRADARLSVVLWWVRQSGAPDPVGRLSVASLVYCLALAADAAERVGLTNRAAWFRSRLSLAKCADTVADLPKKRFEDAWKFVSQLLGQEK